MNWYKLSSYIPRLPSDIYRKVDTTVNRIINIALSLNNFSDKDIFVENISFNDIYTGDVVNNNIYIKNQMQTVASGFANRDRLTGNIYIFIHRELILNKQFLNQEMIDRAKLIYRNAILHELTHAVDTKVNKLNSTYPYSSLNPIEFDGFCREIIEYIKIAYKDINKRKIILNWLHSGGIPENNNIIQVLNINPDLFRTLAEFKNKNMSLYKKFLSRVYNEVINAEDKKQ